MKDYKLKLSAINLPLMIRTLILLITLGFIAKSDAITVTTIDSGAKFSAAFSPHGDSLSLILQGINLAHKTIDIAAYSFTSKPIAIALYAAFGRGVKVRVVADARSNLGHSSVLLYLANHGAVVRLNNHYKIFHDKFMIIDGTTLETGSFNYSAAAANNNVENVLLLWNEASPLISN